MRILPKKETVMMVYPLIVGQYIISVGQAMPSILLLILTVSVIVCLILDRFYFYPKTNRNFIAHS